MNNDYDLGRLMGRREAFTVVAARCSAADAATLRDIREKKLYEGRAKDWDDFCVGHLHSSKTHVNRIIRYLEEFGPAYFEVAQLTRISPATYRAIAPAIRDRTLHHNGEAIALLPENAEKVAAAVNELRKTTTPAEPAPKADRIDRMDRRCTELAAELQTLVVECRDQRERVRAVLGYLRSRIERIELTL